MIKKIIELTEPISGWIIIGQIAIAILLAMYMGVELIRGRRKVDRTDWALMLGLTIAAFCLRWFLPLHGFVHENHHAYGFSPAWNGLWASPHGIPSAHHALAILFFKISPTRTESTFLMNALISAAAVGGVYAWARLIFNDRLAAWSAAVLLATLPVVIAFAPTEEYLVTTSGLALCGLAMLGYGARNDDWIPLICGTMLVCLASSVRDIALPIAATIPAAILIATPREKKLPWRALIIATGLTTITLLPRATLTILLALDPRTASTFFMVQAAIFGKTWIGWYDPMVPGWLVNIFFAGLGVLFINFARTRRWRPLAGALVILVIAQGAAGLIVSGSFPSHLRHQQFAIALITLAPGYLISLFSSHRAHLKYAAFLIAPILGAIALAPAESYRLEYPMMQEYRFFTETVATQEEKATALILEGERGNYVHIDHHFLKIHRPGWKIVKYRDWNRPDFKLPQGEVFLMLDRVCFYSYELRPLYDWQGQSPEESGWPVGYGENPKYPADHVPGDMAQSPFGLISHYCAEALNKWDWTPVASKELIFDPAMLTNPPFHITAPGIPSVQGRERVALLRINK